MTTPEEELTGIRKSFESGRVIWRIHAQERMAERNIRRDDVASVVKTGEIVEAYREDRPFPSYLILGKSKERVLHAVVAWNVEAKTIYIVTVYEPDERVFKADKKSRKKGRDDG